MGTPLNVVSTGRLGSSSRVTTIGSCPRLAKALIKFAVKVSVPPILGQNHSVQISMRIQFFDRLIGRLALTCCRDGLSFCRTDGGVRGCEFRNSILDLAMDHIPGILLPDQFVSVLLQ